MNVSFVISRQFHVLMCVTDGCTHVCDTLMYTRNLVMAHTHGVRSHTCVHASITYICTFICCDVTLCVCVCVYVCVCVCAV